MFLIRKNATNLTDPVILKLRKQLSKKLVPSKTKKFPKRKKVPDEETFRWSNQNFLFKCFSFFSSTFLTFDTQGENEEFQASEFPDKCFQKKNGEQTLKHDSWRSEETKMNWSFFVLVPILSILSLYPKIVSWNIEKSCASFGRKLQGDNLKQKNRSLMHQGFEPGTSEHDNTLYHIP